MANLDWNAMQLIASAAGGGALLALPALLAAAVIRLRRCHRRA
jgi:hypothetical protein